jgi:hypothetical protein
MNSKPFLWATRRHGHGARTAHPVRPADRTKILRDAFMESMADPALLAGKNHLEITAVSGAGK